MNKIFDFSKNSAYELGCVTTSLDQTSIEYKCLPLKYGIRYLTKSKKQAPLQFLKVQLKNRFHRVALADFTKHMWDK